MTYPAILNKDLKTLQAISNKVIVPLVRETVTNGMTVDMLTGNVANILLASSCLQDINTGRYNFKKALLIRIKLVVDALKFNLEKKTVTTIDSDGTMYSHSVETIVGEREPTDKSKVWFKEAYEYQDYVILKGSHKLVDNHSTDLLEAKSEITMKVKEILPEYIDLYVAIIYETNKSKVDEPDYYDRLVAVGEETKAFMGYTYTNYRKLDSNSRNYPLSRFGFSNEYGDAFEKLLVEPAQPWLVTEEEVTGAIQYLRDEFNVTNANKLIYSAMLKLKDNLVLLEQYKTGKVTNFTISHKEVGKLLHIVDVYHNIIDNLDGMTTSCVSYDYTNSGGINASNQFGDKKFLKVMNLLGGDDKFDTHQAVADELGLERDDAKGVMQGPNHGGEVIAEHREMVHSIFGDTYKYIRLTAQYGELLANKGIQSVTLARPDGVTATWYPYTLNCNVSMEDGSTIKAQMPYGGNGEHKVLGLAVSCLHSSDAFVEHYVQSSLADQGIHIRTVLDNFLGRPSIKAKLVKLTFEALNLLRGNMEKQLRAIEIETGIYRGWVLPERECELVPSSNII